MAISIVLFGFSIPAERVLRVVSTADVGAGSPSVEGIGVFSGEIEGSMAVTSDEEYRRECNAEASAVTSS